MRRFRPGAAIAACLLALAVSGCATNINLPATLALETPAAPRGPTVAFESIDGPPPTVFQKLVQRLETEADVRKMAVVTREGPSQYRVRGYMSAQVEARRVTIVWVWDVYDAEQRRVVRLTGQEKAGPAGRDAWNAADDRVLRNIAGAGMAELASFFGNPGQPATAEAETPRPPERVITVATASPPGRTTGR